MSYQGNVTVGGPAETRELPGVTITKVAVGQYDNNAYLLRCQVTGEQLLIDAAAEPETLLALVGDTLAAVVTTHQHGDHWQALAEVQAATGAVTYAGEYDVEGIPTPTQVTVADGDTIRVGEIDLKAIHLVGHTPGSIALLYTDPADPEGHPHLFTGDCLFPGGIGNTQKDAERFATLYRDVTTKLFDILPDDTWIYPGHGKDTTLGAERPHLEEWRARGW
ncbi:MAG TPA: MBL fold metallo-hydrolase [Actinocrinis sp.]|nr:MBL fold metallo-hydrolase [Actinocrinis sp.]